MSFVYHHRIRLHDTDAAGLLFFGHLFRHAQDACEAFFDDLGWPLSELIAERRWLLPLVHAEADYHQAMRHGDAVAVSVEVARVGQSSFTLAYRFCGPGGRLLAQARTVHVCIAGDKAASHPLPPRLRAALQQRLAEVAPHRSDPGPGGTSDE
ncbi:acyl-CoA thioesterase [Thioalkalicoccus limnaeus]|uniref:Acyl-CoA thioesterase n=1 Tax=Thioalkalicoccus limnaeus TaxID=120681 RepID=A0ABV4BCM2_9GAMM